MMKKLFEYVENKDSLCFVIIDEVESLTAMRQAALSGNEPSDAIRVVNSLLTQLDKVNSCHWVFGCHRWIKDKELLECIRVHDLQYH